MEAEARGAGGLPSTASAHATSAVVVWFAFLLSLVMSQPRPKQTRFCEVESRRTFGVGSRAVCADLMGGIDRAGGGTGAGPCGGSGAAAGSASSGLAPYVQCE